MRGRFFWGSSGIATAMVIGTGLLAGLPTPTIAGALTIVGFLATPLHDLGRVVELRQTYRAARRIIGPAIDNARNAGNAGQAGISAAKRAELAVVPSGGPGGAVVARHLELSDGTAMPELAARRARRCGCWE